LKGAVVRRKEDMEQTNTSLYRCMIRFIVDRAVVFSQKLWKRSWRTSFRQSSGILRNGDAF